jgi:uncharacterized protein (TIGR02285 family)
LRQALIATGLVLLASGSLAQTPPQVVTITWLAGDTLAVRRDGQVERPSDRLIQWVQARLPDVEHKRVIANAKRSWMLIRDGEPVCHAGAVRTPERERMALFSNTWLLPPLQLIVHREHVASLPVNAAGHVDLAALLADPAQRGVVVHGRSYGPAVDALLAQRPDHSALRQITSGDFGSNLLPMLLQRRADYAIEYPNALGALGQRRPDVTQLALLLIKGATEPVLSGIACPRTPWGRAAIHLIDRALGTPEGAAMLREGLMAQMPADTARQYREAIDAFFLKRSQPTPGL